MVLEAPPMSRSSPSRCWKIRYNSRIDTAEIMPNRCRSSITAGQRQVQHSGTPQAVASTATLASTTESQVESPCARWAAARFIATRLDKNR